MAVTVAEFFGEFDEGFTPDEKLALAELRLFELVRLRYDDEEISREMTCFANCIETDAQEMP